MKRTCPRCGSTEVKPARLEGVLDRVAIVFGFDPFKCRLCRKHFRGFRDAQPSNGIHPESLKP